MAADILSDLQILAYMENNEYKVNAYEKAIRRVNKIDNISVTDIKSMDIGKSITKTLRDYIKTGKPPAVLRKKATRDKIKIYKQLCGILGAGPKTIAEWVNMGIKDIQGLRRAVSQNRISLTTAQKYGLRYYKDLNTPIPRDEVTEIGKVICNEVNIIAGGSATCTIVGSYRRMHAYSGDIDIIVTGVDLHELIDRLITHSGMCGLISEGSARVTFLYRIHELCRQVDILLTPFESYAAALLYFTGSGEFNQRMRGRAKSMGYKLNQKGLYKNGTILNTPTEHDIFEALNMEYIPPAART